jgi:hypothetical protein
MSDGKRSAFGILVPSSLPGQLLDEVGTERNAVHIHEDAVAAKFERQAIVEAARSTGAVLPTVAEKDSFVRHRQPRRLIAA